MSHLNTKIGLFIAMLLLISAGRSFGAVACSLGAGSLAFGNLDPSSAVNVTINANITVTCTAGNTTLTLSQSGANPGGCGVPAAGGLYDIGANHRMSKGGAGGPFLPYSVTLLDNNIKLKNLPVANTIRLTGTVVAVGGFQNASAGTYTDALTLSICP